MEKEFIVSFETAQLAFNKNIKRVDNFNKPWYNEIGTYCGRTDVNLDGKLFTDVYPEEDSCYGIVKKPEHKKEFKIKSFDAFYLWELQHILSELYNIRVYPTHGVSGNYNFEIRIIETPNNEGHWKRIGNICSVPTLHEAFDKGLQEALTLITQ